MRRPAADTMPTLCSPARQRGYGLLEVSVVVGVLGVLSFAVTAGLENMQQLREHRHAVADAQAAVNALRGFALRNKRLPCPATANSAREPIGNCTQNAGWLPYESLGLAPPATRTRMKYGVHLSATANLVAPTPTAADGLDLEHSGGFIAALREAAASAASNAQPFYIQESALGATPACSGGTLINPAFVVIAPAADLGGNDRYFESSNASFGAGSRCVVPPARVADASVDDVVVAQGSTALLGWISNATR